METKTSSDVNCVIAVTGPSGHTQLEFRDDGVVIDWAKTTGKERDMITAMIENARKEGFTTWALNDEDQPEEITEKLPGFFFNRKGRMLLKTDSPPKLQVLAKGIIDQRIKNGKVAMEVGKDGEWKIISLGDFQLKIADKEPKIKKEVEKKEPQKVHVQEKIGGG